MISAASVGGSSEERKVYGFGLGKAGVYSICWRTWARRLRSVSGVIMSLGEILLLKVAGDVRNEDSFDGSVDASHDCFPTSVDEPPTETEETALKFQVSQASILAYPN